ncbi:hypothetical protein SAY87_000622 [Trapa incisa]|uniref:Uncharacterized protein n=1 Tax=Trapa incisa TaxID=236973 RepID=A0AAN7GFK2_9MYRT|nr:hypothetical protein SAY87_000622 [Trapa incisa]
MSFHGESLSHQVSKSKPVMTRSSSPNTVRKGTPERRKPALAAVTPAAMDQHRWNAFSQSVDLTDERQKLGGSNAGSVVRSLQNSMILDSPSSLVGKLSISNSNSAVPRKPDDVKIKSKLMIGSELTSESLSSHSETSYSQGKKGAKEGHNGGSCSDGNIQVGPRGIVVPARFMQETNNRLQRQQTESGSPLKNIVLKSMVSTPKLIGPKKQGVDILLSSPKGVLNTRGQSPARTSVRPASPIEIRKGKIGENGIVDAHAMRLLYNRLLQW